MMDGKTVVITGGTGGIGLVAARRLGELGARLVLVGSSRSRGAMAAATLRAAGLAPEILYADLSLIAEGRRIGEQLGALDRIDVLVLNAGAIFDKRRETAEGLERTFALNHLGYFVVGNLLMPKLREAAPSRVVVVASEAHRGATLDFADLQNAVRYDGWRAYRRSKLCNLLFAGELSRRLADTGVTVNALHPGFVDSRFGNDNGVLFRLALGAAKKAIGLRPEEGARTTVHLAASPTVAHVTGRYFDKEREREPSAAARDSAAAERLWAESERIVGAAS
jgi:NAD(P)-dependent dehydrogenase (short-subunit alcohol dehydrogenase family)